MTTWLNGEMGTPHDTHIVELAKVTDITQD